MTDHYNKGFRWVVWILSTLFLFYKYAIEVSPSVLASYLMSDFQIDGAQLGSLAACYFYSYLIMQIPAGLLIDRFGPRKVTAIAILFCALGSYLFACTSSIYLAMLGRFLTGIGAAFSAINCLKVTANWFSIKRFAFMAGLMMSIGMLGAVFGQAPLSLFFQKVGWRPALEMMSFAGIALAIVFFLVVRDRPNSKKDEPIAPKAFKVKQGLLELLKKKQTWLLSVFSGFAFAPVTVFGGLWGVPFLMEYIKVSHEGAAHLVSLIFIGFAIGAPLWGYLSDLFKSRKKIMIPGVLLSFFSLSFIIYTNIASQNLLAIFMFFFGFCISTFLLSFTMIKEITTALFAATAIGFMNTFDAFIGAVSDPLTGKILDYFWDGSMEKGARVFPVVAYKLSLSTLPLYLLVSFALIFFMKETYQDENYPSCLP